MKLLKSKKGTKTSAAVMAVLFDLLFSVLLISTLFGFLATLDSGTYYYRHLYSEDISLALSLIEGVPDTVQVNYAIFHGNVFSKKPIRLFLSVSKGVVGVLDSENPAYKTEKNFISTKDFTLSIYAPLDSLMIKKENGNIDLNPTINEKCRTYSREKQEFVTTKLFVTTKSPNQLATDLKDDLLNKIETRYSQELSSYPTIKNYLYNNNVIQGNQNNALTIVYDYVQTSTSDSIVIKYPESFGDSELAQNLGCNFFNGLETYYLTKPEFTGDNMGLLIIPATNDELQPPYKQSNNAILVLNINSDGDNSFDFNQQQFNTILMDSLHSVTKIVSPNTINNIQTILNP